MARTDIQQVDQPDTDDSATPESNGASNRNSFTSTIHGLPVQRISATYAWPANHPVAEITQRGEGYTIKDLRTGGESTHTKVSHVYAILDYISQKG